MAKFSRKELVVLSVIIVALTVVNLINFCNRRRLEKSWALVVEAGLTPVSINHADISDLDDLPGIGPALAYRIVEFRTARGGFRELTDLKKVKGIGDKMFSKILPYIKL
jgi:competence ComEA-like helix-hairpin-helix protein